MNLYFLFFISTILAAKPFNSFNKTSLIDEGVDNDDDIVSKRAVVIDYCDTRHPNNLCKKYFEIDSYWNDDTDCFTNIGCKVYGGFDIIGGKAPKIGTVCRLKKGKNKFGYCNSKGNCVERDFIESFGVSIKIKGISHRGDDEPACPLYENTWINYGKCNEPYHCGTNYGLFYANKRKLNYFPDNGQKCNSKYEIYGVCYLGRCHGTGNFSNGEVFSEFGTIFKDVEIVTLSDGKNSSKRGKHKNLHGSKVFDSNGIYDIDPKNWKIEDDDKDITVHENAGDPKSDSRRC
uniref:Toxin tox21A n=1 Tax=Pyemotes tritici TaxID=6950 RepID=TXPH_PYETR|nr:RecName: Full=Toxin tox21A; AltName: Full=Insect-selective neurotoxin TxP-I homolog; Flags: Precursor [Pyemotes tritici]AAA29801.1 paralytic neurotoxin [Pyemotes tritici]AAB26160.1 precursor [Pyemotes tritici]